MTVRQRQFHDFEFIKLRTVRIITNCQLTNWANRCSSLQSLKFSADHQELENRTDKEAVTNILHRKAQWICLRFPFCRPGFESQANHLSFFKTICIHLHQLLMRIITNWQRTEWCGSLQTFNFSAHHQELERRTDKEDPASKLRRNLLRRNWNAAASRCRWRHVVRRAAEAKPRPHKDSKVQVNSGAGRKMWKHWKAQNQSCLQICNHYTQTRSHSTMVR